MSFRQNKIPTEHLGPFRHTLKTARRELYIQEAESSRALSFFVTNWTERQILKAAIKFRLGDLLRMPILLNQLTKIRRLTNGVPIGILIGTRGPFQKATILLKFSDNKFGAAKLAFGTRADAQIEREIDMLRFIQTVPDLASYVPSLVHVGMAADRRFLVQSAVFPGRRHSNARRTAESLLEALAKTAGDATFSKSQGWSYLRQSFKRCSASLPVSIHDRFESILCALNKECALMSLPAPVVHRDFARWNYVVANGRPLLFDWEYSLKSGNPIQDHLHWYLLPLAVRGRVPSNRELLEISATVLSSALKFWPQAPWTPKIIQLLFDAYLLDVLLFYAEADQGLRMDSAVVCTFLKLLMGKRLHET